MADALRGRFTWHELLTSATQSAVAFYSRIVGWKTQSWAQDPSYTLLEMGSPMAGCMAMPADMPAGVPPHRMS